MPKNLPSYQDCEYRAWSQLTPEQQKEARRELQMQRPPEQYHYLVETRSGRVSWAYPKRETPDQLKQYEREYWEGCHATR